jgi:hypothetical protein
LNAAALFLSQQERSCDFLLMYKAFYFSYAESCFNRKLYQLYGGM